MTLELARKLTAIATCVSVLAIVFTALRPYTKGQQALKKSTIEA